MAQDAKSPSTATEWLIARIHEYGFERFVFFLVVIVAASAAIGYLLNWLLSRSKINREIEQNEIQNRASYLAIHKEFELSEEKLNESNRLLNASLSELVKALEKARKSTLRSLRGDLCEFYSSDFIAALERSAQRADIVLKPRDKRRFVLRTAIPHLIVMRRFAEAINHPGLLAKLDNPAPYLFSRFTCSALKDMLMSFIPLYFVSYRFRVYLEFWRIRKHCRK